MPEEALGQQIVEPVPHFPRLPIIDQTPRKALDQTVLSLGGLQQHGAAIGTGVRLIEGRDEGPVEEVGKENSLWYRFGRQRQRLRCGESAVSQRLSSMRRRLCIREIARRRELSGLTDHGSGLRHERLLHNLTYTTSGPIIQACRLPTDLRLRRAKLGLS